MDWEVIQGRLKLIQYLSSEQTGITTRNMGIGSFGSHSDEINCVSAKNRSTRWSRPQLGTHRKKVSILYWYRYSAFDTSIFSTCYLIAMISSVDTLFPILLSIESFGDLNRSILFSLLPLRSVCCFDLSWLIRNVRVNVCVVYGDDERQRKLN